MNPAELWAAFMVGLLGGVHCLGMCGGIVGALTMGLPESVRQAPARLFPFVLSYNLGRLASYTTAGLLLGGLSQSLLDATDAYYTRAVAGVVIGLIMVALGLYLGGWWQGLAHLERMGGRIWRRLEPLGRRFLPVTSRRQALALGLVWGWLPCGLVYSVLLWSITSGQILMGGALMLSFGLGTLLPLLLMGMAAARLAAFVRNRWVRNIAGGMIIGYGVSRITMVLL